MLEYVGECTAYCAGMGVRAFFAIASIVSLGVLTAACSRPSEPGASPSRSAVPSELPSGLPSGLPTVLPSGLPTSAPGVSWLRVSPEQGAPGSAVSLDVACLDSLGAVRSPVLDIGALKGNPDGHQPWHLAGTATVGSDAAPGRYQVSTTCGTIELSTTFTVLGARSR
jgi:hypothetical protein